jgi:uncharacterized RDD family membrane protein YckC
VSDRSHYDVLGVDQHGSKADVKAAYVGALDAAQSSGDSEEIARVRRAWQVLSDPVQRQRYDDEIGVTKDVGRTVEHVSSASEVEVEVLDDDVAPRSAPRAPGFSAIPDFLEQPGLGRRLTASLIDVVTVLAVFFATITVTFQITGADTGTAGVVTFLAWVEFWILALFVIPTVRTGQTLGKRLTYIMTVDRDTGDLPGVGQVLRRYFVPMISIPALFQLGAFLSLFFGLSYSMGRDQLSLPDRFARTVVVVARYTPTRPGSAA